MLEHEGTFPMAQLPPMECKLLLNKVLPWALFFHAQQNGGFTVVREIDGKMVCTEDGMSVAGLRIFRGTTAAVLQLAGTEKSSSVPELPPALDPTVPKTQVLKLLSPRLVTEPIIVKCTEIVRSFYFKEHLVQSYLVADASGRMGITFWGFGANVLVPGKCYSISCVKAKEPAKGFQRGDFNVELDATFGIANVEAIDTGSSAAPTGSVDLLQPNRLNLIPDANRSLALRIDTRCTVAAEKSMWEEVKQHFGDPPYDEEKQRRIARAVQGTPVVISTTLRHTAVRIVRFDYKSPDDVALEPQLRQLSNQFDVGQPYAVLNDYSVVPLQVLHCCFDPKMRSWQDVTVPCLLFHAKKA